MTDEQAAPGPAATAAGPARRALPAAVLPLATALAVVMVAAGGTVAYRSLSGDDGPRPAEAAPGSTFAYLEVDLDPSAGERIDLYQFSRRLPGSPTEGSGSSDSVVDQLLDAVVEATGADVDYARDVRPWLGGSAGVAAYRDAKGHAAVVGLLGYDDRDDAARALDKVFAEVRTEGGAAGGYAFTDDFVVVGADRVAAEEVARQDRSEALAGSDPFAQDVDALGERLVTLWVDPRAAVQAVGDQFGGLLGGLTGLSGSVSGAVPPSEPTPGTRAPVPAPTFDPDSVPEGTFVLGLSVDSDVAEVEVRSSAGEGPSGHADARDLATHLPDDTTGVLAVGDVRPAIRSGVAALRKGPLSGLVDQALTSAERESGLRLPDDLLTLLGHAAALSAKSEDGADGDLVLRTRPDDLEAARAVATKLERLAKADGDDLVVRVEGDELVLASSATAAAAVLRGGDLDNQSLFRKAVGAVPAEPVVVGFLDLRPFLDDGGDDLAGHLRAVGVTASAENGASVFRVRLVVE